MNRKNLTECEMRENLANNLNYLRKNHNCRLSQKSLARLLNLPVKTIRNYEKGRSSPLAYAVFRIATQFGFSMEELLTETIKKGNEQLEHQSKKIKETTP